MAAEQGHAAAVSTLLRNCADPNKAAPKGATPLLIGAQLGWTNVVRALLEDRRTDPTRMTSDRSTALHAAVIADTTEGVAAIAVAAPALLEFRNRHACTPLLLACKRHKIHSVVTHQLIQTHPSASAGRSPPLRLSWWLPICAQLMPYQGALAADALCWFDPAHSLIWQVALLDARADATASHPKTGETPISIASAARNEGKPELVAALVAHRERLRATITERWRSGVSHVMARRVESD